MNTALVPKNIVYIMLDDADFADVGFNNVLLENPDAITPNIDFLRDNGKSFSQFYSGSAICSPTRSSVLTGHSPLQFGAVDAWPQLDASTQSSNGGLNGLPNTIPHLGQVMKEAGLNTGHFGKWHVGLARPEYGHEAFGFDTFSYHNPIPGVTDNRRWDSTYEFVSEAGSQQVDVDYIDKYFADQALNFIDLSLARDENFYLNYWPLTPHFPWVAPETFDNSETNFDLSSDRGQLLAMMYTIDQEIGRIISKLSEAGALNETLIVVTSDNGGQSRVLNSTPYFQGFKGNLFEGGIHVPFVAFWPEGIEANSTNDSVVTTTDLLPTFAELLGQDVTALDQAVTGDSKAKAFISDQVLDHDDIVWQLAGNPLETVDARAQQAYAYREGGYKIIKAENRNDLTNPIAYFLYNLSEDPREQRNLRNSHPELLAELKRKLLRSRVIQSRFGAIGPTISEQEVIEFDPRLDPTTKDMTFTFDVDVPSQIESVKNIFHKPGTQQVTLQEDGSIHWDVTGSDNLNNPISEVLSSGPLSEGTHKITLLVSGFKRADSRISLYVDGFLIAELDNGAGVSGLQSLWSTTSDLILGDDDLVLQNVHLLNLRFYTDEVDSFANNLFQTWEDTSQQNSVQFESQTLGTWITGAPTQDAGDTYTFTDLALSELLLTAQGSQTQFSWGDGTQAAQVTIDQIHTGQDVFHFADGTTLGGIQADYLQNLGGTFSTRTDDLLYGTDGDDLIQGGSSSEQIRGLAGNDTLTGGVSDGLRWHYLLGQEGSDTYRYSKDSTRMFIVFQSEALDSSDTDRLVFEDLMFEELSISYLDYGDMGTRSARNGNALRLRWFDGGEYGEVRIAHEGAAIESYEFSDGTILSASELTSGF